MGFLGLGSSNRSSAGGRSTATMVATIALLLIISGTEVAAIKSAAAAGAEICGISIDELLTCKPAVEAPESVPAEECCRALEKVKPPTCLCKYQNYLPAFGIDKNVAIHLPHRCNLDNAKSFHC